MPDEAKIRNPAHSVAAQLGLDAATYKAACDAIRAYLDAHPTDAEIPESTLRATHAALKDPRVWNQALTDVTGVSPASVRGAQPSETSPNS
jgi:hypothetical protein